MSLTIELPPHGELTDFNLEVWDRVLADREIAKVEGRIEECENSALCPDFPSHIEA